jgi:Lon protease-like protein
MIQPEDPYEAPEHPAVYANGCIGRITALTETPDQRYLISLSGVCRFRVTRELPPEGLLYRRVYASYDEYAGDLVPPGPCRINRARLLPALRGFFEANGLTADWDAINGAEDELLITCLAMACPFQPSEKQALLECADDSSRVAMMQALFEMAAHERGEADDDPVIQ